MTTWGNAVWWRLWVVSYFRCHSERSEESRSGVCV